MPIDPSIYSLQRPVPFNDAFARLRDVQEHQQRAQLNQQAISSNQALEEQRRQDTEAQRRAEVEDAQLRAEFATGDPKPERIFSIVGPVRGAKVLEGLSAVRKLAQGDFTNTQELLRKSMLGLEALPEALRAESYPKTRAIAVQAGAIREEDAPPDYDPQWFTRTVNWGKEKEKPAVPTAFTLTPGQKHFDPSGKLLAEVPKDVEHSPQFKEWTDYQAAGGKLDFPAYQNMDANRHKPVSITNAATDDKMIDEAARNILANPRDLTSIKNISSLRGDQRMKLFNKIKELDPTFNAGNIDRQIKFLDSYEDPKGRAATNRGSMNNILQHAADLNAVNDYYKRTDLRFVNIPIAALSRQGGTAWQKFETPLAVLKDEIGLYFAGGYAPSGEQLKMWNRIVNDTATPAQVVQFSKDLAHAGLRRADTHNEQFKTVMGYDDPNLITPQAVDAANRLGMGEEVKKYGSGGRIGTKPSGPRLGEVRTANGETRKWNGTEWVLQ